jgi:hypothetical protein
VPASFVGSPGGGFTYSFVGATDPDGASLSLLESIDLDNESWAPVLVTPTLTPAGTGKSTFDYAIPVAPEDERLFLRLKASFSAP